jgi:oligoendopeptidase F
MIWDLSQLVGSTDSALIKKKLEEGVAEVEKVRNDYRGKIGVLDAKGVSELLESKDALTLKHEAAVKYCFLMYAANSTDETAKQLNDTARRAMMQVGQKLAFVDIELGKLVTAKPGLVKDSKLTGYRHYLERLLRRVPHMLSETEEQLVIVKDKNGINAWETLQSDWLSTGMFQ